MDQPIETISHKIGICIVSPKGKASKTLFERLNYNNKSSTVLCKPETGRMHQIRVHLQYLGYPITNDSFYNSPSFGPNKGKGGDFGKSIEEVNIIFSLWHVFTLNFQFYSLYKLLAMSTCDQNTFYRMKKRRMKLLIAL